MYSIFEDQTDIIKKGQRDRVYGHKIFLSTGKSSLILGKWPFPELTAAPP